MSEASDQPVAEDTSAAGVAADIPAATDDLPDAEFDAINTVVAPDDDGDDESPDAGEEPKPAPVDDLVEVEAADGSKVKVPAKLKEDFLRHADYTRKTQELAEHRRTFEAESQTWEQQREASRAALPEEHAKVAIADHAVEQARVTVAEFEKIDWATWRAQTQHLPADDPNRAQYQQYRSAYDAARETMTDAQRELGVAKETLTAKEQARLDEQAKGHETALATARQETGKTLAAEGWDQQRFADVASFAVTELGVRPEELAEVTDPRTWRLALRAYTAEQRATKAEAALKQNKTAETNLKAQASRPAELAKGNAQPARVRDDISTDAWMRNRQKQVERKRA